MRTWSEMHGELYEIIRGKDVKDLRSHVAKYYPKSKGDMNKVPFAMFEGLITYLREVYCERQV